MVRGLLALAPPPAPPPSYPAPGVPCPGLPGGPANLSTTPVLTDTVNCGRCLALYQFDYTALLSFWQENTPYHRGNVVAPKTYNGFAYRAQNDGTSGVYGIDPLDGSPLDPPWPAKLSATYSDNSPGCNLTPGNDCLVWKAEPEPLCAFLDRDFDGNPDIITPGTRNNFPLLDRGFDDPQADPDLTFLPVPGKKIYITYTRADLFGFPQPPGCDVVTNPDPCIFPYRQQANDARNGNPPWGSQPLSRPRRSGLEPPQRHGRRRRERQE